MLKAISRASVDLRNREVLSVIFQLVNINKSSNNNRVPEFEKSFARYIGTKDAVSFPMCRSGMYFTLKALNFNKGDEVILPAFTFWVDAAMVLMAGLSPVFVDVQFDTATIDPGKIEAAITPKTKAIFLTHLNGLPADMDPVMDIARKHNLRIIEDCARSCGATYKNKRIGSFDLGAFSFGYGKSFYGFGGGMVTSDDEDLIEGLREIKKGFTRIKAKDLRFQTVKGIILRYANIPLLYRFSLYQLVYQYHVKMNEKYASLFRVKMPFYDTVPESFMIDFNNLQAKLGFKQLERIDHANKRRMENASILNQELSGIPSLMSPASFSDREHVSVHYAIWTERKKELQDFLIKNRIDAQDETAVDTTSLERFKPYVKGEFPNSKMLHDRLIFLPTHPYLKKKDMLYMAQKVKEFFEV